jgi:hypothetical protein
METDRRRLAARRGGKTVCVLLKWVLWSASILASWPSPASVASIFRNNSDRLSRIACPKKGQFRKVRFASPIIRVKSSLLGGGPHAVKACG